MGATHSIECSILMRCIRVERRVLAQEAGLIRDAIPLVEIEDVHDWMRTPVWKRERARKCDTMLIDGVWCGTNFVS
jgi:hypothetical protein